MCMGYYSTYLKPVDGVVAALVPVRGHQGRQSIPEGILEEISVLVGSPRY